MKLQPSSRWCCKLSPAFWTAAMRQTRRDVFMTSAASEPRIMDILHAVKKLGQEYRSLTGKPLGITGEIAEYEAARILNLELTAARQAGYDAIDSTGRRYQIKGRCLLPNSKPSQRIGSIATTNEFDAVLLVLLNDRFDAT